MYKLKKVIPSVVPTKLSIRFSSISILLMTSALALTGCNSLLNHEPVAPEVDELLVATEKPLPRESIPLKREVTAKERVTKKNAEFYPGNGVFVGHSHYNDNQLVLSDSTENPAGDITLNFSGTDIHEVIKVILGDLLKRNYIVDPVISGSVNIQTSKPLRRDDLISVLDNILRMSGATLVEDDGMIKVIPTFNAALSSLPPSIGNSISSDASGFHTQIIPLRYVGVEEINELIQPFIKETLVKVYPQRNIIILSGAQTDIRRLVETIHIFDVDWLKGMSLAMVPINHANANDIVNELESLFGESSKSPMANIVQFISLERLNSVIIVSKQPRYLKEMHDWIQRLDRSDGIAGQRLYVYQVQNKRANELAEVLNMLFTDQGGSTTQPPAELAPGLEPVTLNSNRSNDLNQPDLAGQNPEQPPQATGPALIGGDGLALPSSSTIKIIADESNNSLVVLASPADYQMIESALRKLDITPLQVLIEASIIEVSLTDELSYGLEWFFKNGIGSSTKGGIGSLDLGDAGINALSPGFSYGVVDAAGSIRAVLNTLASESKVNVLSSPSLMVLDNHEASINIGDQVPILTSQSTSNLTDTAQTVNQIEYRDTGVLMSVTPRVNASGLIIMDIKQEVTDVAETNSSGIDAPTFQQRTIESTISVNTGKTIVLGGLIRDNRSTSESGIPKLHKLPFIGPLFGQTSNNLRRTELVILLTPRVIRNDQDAWEVTNEFKQKLNNLRHSMEQVQ